ncbi:hypothetical protein N431DRAFT_347759 [Stipitochalara longipes BDJ]|nr:hypothetical protein N431DRAFT_347759 [Stipitochalara longipes BDJ]
MNSLFSTNPTKTQLFLTNLDKSSYGPILKDFDQYIKHKLEEYDDFIRRTIENERILATENREVEEKAVQECFERLMGVLKGMMSDSAHLIASALVAPHAFSVSGERIRDTPESLAVAVEYEKKLDDYLKIELQRLYDDIKDRKKSTTGKFHRLNAEITKKYDREREEVDEGLRELFERFESALVGFPCFPCCL